MLCSKWRNSEQTQQLGHNNSKQLIRQGRRYLDQHTRQSRDHTNERHTLEVRKVCDGSCNYITSHVTSHAIAVTNTADFATLQPHLASWHVRQVYCPDGSIRYAPPLSFASLTISLHMGANQSCVLCISIHWSEHCLRISVHCSLQVGACRSPAIYWQTGARAVATGTSHKGSSVVGTPRCRWVGG